MVNIIVIGTFDSKFHELLYLRSQILEAAGSTPCHITTVDVGRSHLDHQQINIQQGTLTTKYAPSDESRVSNVDTLERGDLVKYMVKCATNWLKEAYENGLRDPDAAVHGVIGAGGTGNTSLVSKVMQDALPIGLPKLIVSTAASGETGPIVGESDITLMYSVVDIAGLNSLLRRILNNAAGAILGMAVAYQIAQGATSRDKNTDEDPKASERHKVGLTMFGVTTTCADKIRSHLEENYPIECFVFHCTGHGGRAMERLVTQGELDAVIDLTTTEICDLLAGGVMSAGEARLEAALKAGIPCIISNGATDMVNFGPRHTVPDKYKDRLFIEHNPTVTLMRTNRAETEAIGEFIADKIVSHAKDKSKVEVVLPTKGVSMLAVEGKPFHSPESDGALRDALRRKLGSLHDQVVFREEDFEINDNAFAIILAERLVALMGLKQK